MSGPVGEILGAFGYDEAEVIEVVRRCNYNKDEIEKEVDRIISQPHDSWQSTTVVKKEKRPAPKPVNRNPRYANKQIKSQQPGSTPTSEPKTSPTPEQPAAAPSEVKVVTAAVSHVSSAQSVVANDPAVQLWRAAEPAAEPRREKSISSCPPPEGAVVINPSATAFHLRGRSIPEEAPEEPQEPETRPPVEDVILPNHLSNPTGDFAFGPQSTIGKPTEPKPQMADVLFANESMAVEAQCDIFFGPQTGSLVASSTQTSPHQQGMQKPTSDFRALKSEPAAPRGTQSRNPVVPPGLPSGQQAAQTLPPGPLDLLVSQNPSQQPVYNSNTQTGAFLTSGNPMGPYNSNYFPAAYAPYGGMNQTDPLARQGYVYQHTGFVPAVFGYDDYNAIESNSAGFSDSYIMPSHEIRQPVHSYYPRGNQDNRFNRASNDSYSMQSTSAVGSRRPFEKSRP